MYSNDLCFISNFEKSFLFWIIDSKKKCLLHSK